MWEKEFDEFIGEIPTYFGQREKRNTEKFIQQALDNQKLSLLAEIEGKWRYRLEDEMGACLDCGLDRYECKCLIYNQGLEEAIKLIKEK